MRLRAAAGLFRVLRPWFSFNRGYCDKIGLNRFANRTHTCGQLRLTDAGQSVTLCGWLQFQRMRKFLVLYDAYGSIQVMILRTLNKSALDRLKSASLESVLQVSGVVQPRPETQRNPGMPTGDVEVVLEDFEILNHSDKSTMQVSPGLDHVAEAERHRMQHRYLDLRQNKLQRNLRFRSKMVHSIRRFLIERCDFVEIETPTLFRRTPGGAAEFIVPSSEEKGLFYALPQSPQQFKQLLMVGGFDRYFQIARCYRDEFITSERQPEFTQVDLEVSFTDALQVRQLVESIIVESWPTLINQDKCAVFEDNKRKIEDNCPANKHNTRRTSIKFSGSPPSLPFTEMTYENAMNLYGTDKPDLRFDARIVDLTNAVDQFSWTGIDGDIVKAFNGGNDDKEPAFAAFVLPGIRNYFGFAELQKLWPHMHQRPFTTSYSLLSSGPTTDEQTLEEFANDYAVPSDVRIAAIGNLNLADNDLAVIAWGKGRSNVWQTLGALRFKIAEAVERIRSGSVYTGNPFSFVWITDFPLFVRSRDTNKLESNHHPFTTPVPEHLELIRTDPDAVLGQHYDLVLNGVELGGGSIRIHDAELQRFVLEQVLREDPAELEHLLAALSHGAPPHGGFALGLDRYLAILCSADSIKDVIAFPKAQSGRDTMAKAPARVSQKVLDRYGIQLSPADEAKKLIDNDK